ncbi:MAG: hypothetical protein WDO18_03830 [Acidobacteriota bacterium]
MPPNAGSAHSPRRSSAQPRRSSVGSAPADYAALGGYTVVFNQILPDSPHIEADMEDLRLRPSDRQFIGTHAYQDEAGLRDPVLRSGI